MSQHEVEAVVEQAVKLLATSKLPRQYLRSCYFTLFELQGCFDTGFTHFRCMQELLAARFVYCVEPFKHPDFERAKPYFEALTTFTFVEVPGCVADGSYFAPPYLYFDAGSKLWERLVSLDLLWGEDAESPAVLSLQSVMLDVAKLAEASENVELVACCYRLLILGLMLTEKASLELTDDASVLALRRIVKRTDALDIEFREPTLRDPDLDDETLRDHPILSWWFDVSDAVPLS